MTGLIIIFLWGNSQTWNVFFLQHSMQSFKRDRTMSFETKTVLERIKGHKNKLRDKSRGMFYEKTSFKKWLINFLENQPKTQVNGELQNFQQNFKILWSSRVKQLTMALHIMI